MPYVASSLPITIPSTCSLFQRFDRSLVFITCGGHLNLSLLHFGLVFSFFLTHDHMTLRKVAFNFEAILLISVPRLVAHVSPSLPLHQ